MKKTAANTAAKIKQAHGGELLSGGAVGNKGGSGRPSNAIRARCAASFDQRIGIAEEIADDAALRPNDRLAAISLLARLGGLFDLNFDAADAEKRAKRSRELEVLLGDF